MGFGAGQGHVAAAALAAERGGMPERTPGTATGLPVPRFVSLKSGRANVRRGPGTDFPIDWVYRKSGLPLEVIAESSNWRRIRDHEGDGGWIWHSMLDGERTAIMDAADGAPVALHKEPADGAPVIAYAEKGPVARVKSCKARWCRLETGGYEGWVLQETLWGVYPGEEFE
jgi:SH3-like domain-containing protein